jgi:outer membrane receptor protein involved in Fe transport
MAPDLPADPVGRHPLNVTHEVRDEGEEAGGGSDEGDRQTNTRPTGHLGALVSLVERGTNHLRVFANYRNTFKPAVFDVGLGEAGEGGLLDPETSGSVEGGVKTRIMDGRIDFEASAFRVSYSFHDGKFVDFERSFDGAVRK